MLDAAYTAWQHDQAAGKTSLLIAPTREQVTALNTRARADRITTGDVDPSIAVRLHDGSQASPGDVITTRRNNRRAATTSGRWVRNGDRWTLSAIHPDGSITATSPHGGRVLLTADYTAAHVELGYATTAHRGQGATVDTAHTIVTSAMTRETLYVGMTRGRHANHAYTCTDTPDTPDTEPHQHHEPPVARQVLAGVLARTGAEPSAHARIAAEQDRYGGIAQLAAEYETIAATAQRPRWTRLVHASGLTPEQAEHVITSDAFGPLCAALRRAEAHGAYPEPLLPHLAEARPLEDVDDIASVLHHRLDTTIRRQAQHGLRQDAPRLIAGLVPHAAGPMAEGMRSALDQRHRLIHQRAVELARTALNNREAWTRHLGPPPTDPYRRREWLRDLTTIAAYRDRHGITGEAPLGLRPQAQPQQDEAYAAAALHRAQHAATAQRAAADVGPGRRRTPERPGMSR